MQASSHKATERDEAKSPPEGRAVTRHAQAPHTDQPRQGVVRGEAAEDQPERRLGPGGDKSRRSSFRVSPSSLRSLSLASSRAGMAAAPQAQPGHGRSGPPQRSRPRRRDGRVDPPAPVAGRPLLVSAVVPPTRRCAPSPRSAFAASRASNELNARHSAERSVAPPPDTPCLVTPLALRACGVTAPTPGARLPAQAQ